MIFLYLLPAIIAMGLLLYACWTDINEFVIPNWLSISVFFLCIIQFILFHHGFPSWESAGIAFGLIFILFGSLWWFKSNSFGGGDWKLMSALSLWSGLESLFNFITITFIAGGVEVIIALIIRKKLSQTFLKDKFPLFFEHAGVPYGIPIAIAGIYVIISEITTK